MKKHMAKVVSLLASLVLMMSLLTVASMPTTAAGENLAVNGDLEMGSTNGWETAHATLDSSIKYAGNYSLKLTATSAYVGAALKAVPVGKGATVTVSFYYRYASNPGGATYDVYTYQGANDYGGHYSDAMATLTASTTWRQASYTFNSGDFATICLKFCPGFSGSSTCYIDNLVVTATGGTVEQVLPYLTSFGTKYNRPSHPGHNLIAQGGFESTTGAAWNTATFLSDRVQVVADATAPDGDKCLYFTAGATAAGWHTFPVAVEPYNQYTFSAWVKSPRLSADNNATATVGVADGTAGQFLVYSPYQGNGNGAALLSSPTQQIMATAPDGEWHLRSVSFYSGTATTVKIALYGAQSHLWLDDIALYKSAYGVEYISELRSATITATANGTPLYCANADALIPAPHMTGSEAETHWSANPAWRSGFLSFADTGDDHNRALRYTASVRPLKLAYIDWIDVQPGTEYTLTMDVKRLAAGGGSIALLDDNVIEPQEFYTLSFSSVDEDWVTYSITFNTGVYSRIGFAIIDGGGESYIDKTRLFETSLGQDQEPADPAVPTLKPMGGQTSAMEMADAKLGVAFMMELEAQGVVRNEWYEADFSAATVCPFGDGEAYRLVGMGSLMTNKASIGTDEEQFRLEYVGQDNRLVDIPAIYLYEATENKTSFAVRIINVPTQYADVVIFARPYYVFERNGQQMVVYGDVYSRSYNNRGEDVYMD